MAVVDFDLLICPIPRRPFDDMNPVQFPSSSPPHSIGVLTMNIPASAASDISSWLRSCAVFSSSLFMPATRKAKPRGVSLSSAFFARHLQMGSPRSVDELQALTNALMSSDVIPEMGDRYGSLAIGNSEATNMGLYPNRWGLVNHNRE